MSTIVLDARIFKKMLIGGAAMLALHKEELNDLNVFPVADGDTGSNMSMTLDGALASFKDSYGSIGELARDFNEAIMLCARGNSGVILSQIFTGICDVLKKHDTVSVDLLAEAYRSGIKKSYAAVQNPTEGTILTVFRESTEYASANTSNNSTFEDFFRLHTEEAERSLKRTKELLPALKEADVRDSGAAGYVYVAQGMRDILEGKEIVYTPASYQEAKSVKIDAFDRNSTLEYGYCTELLLRLTTSKVDPDLFDISTAISALEDLGGESIVAYKNDDIVKVHVHTFCPGEIMNAMQKYGEFLTVKVENMSLGHTGTEKEKPRSNKAYSVISVCEGDGICALFKEMGADVTVEGGQSKNPSTKELIDAFKRCTTDNIIVLPNNKNIIFAAEQAKKLYTGAAVHVINSKNIAEGYAALSVINPAFKDISVIVESAERAVKSIVSAEITRAVRSVTLDGRSIEEGDYIAISGGEISAVASTPEDAVLAMLASEDTDLCEIITLFVGKNVSDDKRTYLTERLGETYPDCKITAYNGDQSVYDYIIAME